MDIDATIQMILTFIVLQWDVGSKVLAALTGIGALVTAMALLIRALSGVAAALTWVAELTPSKRDNVILADFQAVLKKASAGLDWVGARLAKIPAKIHGK